MKTKRPSSVAQYLQGLSRDQRPVLERLVALARTELPGFEEGIQYGMPYFQRGTTAGVGFASRKGFVAIYAGEPVLSEFRSELVQFDLGKGCLRIRHPGEIDWRTIARLLRSVGK